MLCPKCNHELNNGERFCSNCGADMQSVINISAPQTQPVQSVPQYSQPVQPDQSVPQYSQSAQSVPQYSQPVPQYSQPVPQQAQPVPQYTQQAQPYIQYPQPVQTAPKKKRSKAPLIVAGVAATVLVGGGVAGFFAYQNFAAQTFVRENPTKAVANSYTTYLSERKDPGTAGLFNIITKAKDKGTVKLTYDYSYDYHGYGDSGKTTMTYSYDKDAKLFYLNAGSDNLGTFFGTGSSTEDKKFSTLELFTDTKIVNLRYDIEGNNGSYYLDAEHFRESAQNSIFSPSKENINNLTDAEFEEIVSSFEKLYDNVTGNLEQKENEYIDKLVEIIEKNGNPVVTEEKVKVRGKDRDVYTVTYTFSRESLIAAVKDLKKVVIDAAGESNTDAKGLDDLKGSIEKTFDDIVESLGKADDSLQIVLKSSIDKGSKQAARMEVTANNISESVDTVSAFIEFGNDSEIDIYAEYSVSGEKGGKASLAIKSTKDGSKTRYSADVNAKSNDNEKDYNAGVALIYDDSAKTYALTYTVNGEEKTVLEGKADISGNTASFTVEQPIIQHFVPKSADGGHDVETGKYVLTIDISCETNIVNFKGDKDIMGLTKEDLIQFNKQFPNSSGNDVPFSYDPNDYGYSYDDYGSYYDDDSSNIDFNESNRFFADSNIKHTSYALCTKGVAGLLVSNLAS